MQDDTTSVNPLPECILWIGVYNFQDILNGTAGSLGGTSKFVDCVDDRHSSGTCSTAADNANCHQNDTCVTNGNLNSINQSINYLT